MKSATAVTANYLERVADPTCRFHADYLEYKKRRISRAQLIARLPHIAMIGDSVSKNAYISSILSTFWRARTRHQYRSIIAEHLQRFRKVGKVHATRGYR